MSIVVFSFAIFVLFRGHSSLEEASRLVLHDSNFPILFFQRRYWAVLPSFCQALSGDAEQRRDSPQSGPLLCCSVSAATVEEASRLFSCLPRQNRSIPCGCFRRKDRPISTFCLPIPLCKLSKNRAPEHRTHSILPCLDGNASNKIKVFLAHPAFRAKFGVFDGTLPPSGQSAASRNPEKHWRQINRTDRMKSRPY